MDDWSELIPFAFPLVLGGFWIWNLILALLGKHTDTSAATSTFSRVHREAQHRYMKDNATRRQAVLDEKEITVR
jgi:hypothetical protein